MSRGVPHYVLRYVAQGQDWPEGDATFHRRILAPTLLVHGLQDPYVTLVQECEMERVSCLMNSVVFVMKDIAYTQSCIQYIWYFNMNREI
jgi:hypothetical protein